MGTGQETIPPLFKKKVLITISMMFPDFVHKIPKPNVILVFVLQRGSDVPHSPVTYAYLIVEVEQAKLFVDGSKVTPEVKDHLQKASIDLRSYDSILSEIERQVRRSFPFFLSLTGRGSCKEVGSSSIFFVIKAATFFLFSSMGRMHAQL